MGLVSFFQRKDRERTIKKLYVIVDKVNAFEESMKKLSDEELRAKTDEFRERVKQGETLDSLLPEAFAVMREASSRVLNMRHYDVQIVGGIVLHQGRIAEMKTGEGKTLVATLPAYLNSLGGKSVHIVTVNDYLARRDAEWMGKVYKFLGLTVGCVYPGMDNRAKKAAYNADITYCTNNELGFDYLRDNMVKTKEQRMQRDRTFAIVDEVDSILIDEARTPLIISAPAEKSGDIYERCQRFINVIARLQDKENNSDKPEEERACYYTTDEKEKSIYLGEEGITEAEKFFKVDLSEPENADLVNKVNNALRANFMMDRDVDYIVEDGEVVIVDEFTGRKMIGRRFSDGLHQAIEAKENVKIKRENRTIATITFQNLFRLYDKLSGMTGTAMTEEAEFKGIYNLDVVEIPTHMEMIRVDEPDKVFATKEAKFNAAVEEIIEVHATGQPILVGTVSVEVSESISKKLARKGIQHRVLNAKEHKKEAEIIAQAGKKNAITIATNMAGRGTDILLGGNPEFMAKQQMSKEGFNEDMISVASAYNTLTDPEQIKARERYNELVSKFKKETDAEKEEVRALGGLRVIGTERHESRRIDNQLRGRSGRQGDAGSSVFYISCEDEVMRRFGGDRIKAIMSYATGDGNQPIQMGMLSKAIEMAQKRCEEANFERRKFVINYDDVMNKQRQLIYTQRDEVIDGADVHDQIIKYIRPIVQDIIVRHVDLSKGDETTVDYDALNRELEMRLLKKGTNFVDNHVIGSLVYDNIINAVTEEAVKQYEEKSKFAEENGLNWHETERQTLLYMVDKYWMQHIDNMDALRKGIGLRGLGQRDPVIEYRREGMDMFDEMVDNIQANTASALCKADVEKTVKARNEEQRKFAELELKRRGLFPDMPCKCGSGKRYKDCCREKDIAEIISKIKRI